jgi:D-alanine-D-alanine ligase
VRNTVIESAVNKDWQKDLKTAVAVLLGGSSAEREISLQSGNAVLKALQKQGVDAVAIDTADRTWLKQVQDHYAHAFIALHGVGGEDGTVQGALEMLGVSYTGSGVMASALAMDKLRTKQMWQGIGLPTPNFAVLSDDSDFEGLMGQWREAIVKPAHEGSSIGMSRANSAEQLREAYEKAKQYDQSVLAEQWVHGAEFTVAILGGKALPAIRLETDHSFYDYDAKYLANDTRYLCPCGLSAEKEKLLQGLAQLAFDSVGCKGWGRVDFMQNQQGEFFLLEVNTVPGMTSHSLVPMAARAAGYSFDELVVEVLRLSVSES